MKKVLLFLSYFLGCLTIACAGTQPVVPVTPQQNEVVIRLPANPTTGYQWVLKSYDKKYLKLIKQQYNASSKRLMGSGGETAFYFQCVPAVKRPHDTMVKLVYARPWEKNSGKITVVNVVFLKD